MSPDTSIPPHGSRRAMPESLRGRALTAALTVNDVEKSLAWYRDVVGFTVDQRYERDGALTSVSLKAGDVRIILSQDDGAKGRDRVKGEGFSLRITTVQSLDQLAERIKSKGGTLESEPANAPWGGRLFRLRDPDGFKLVIASLR